MSLWPNAANFAWISSGMPSFVSRNASSALMDFKCMLMSASAMALVRSDMANETMATRKGRGSITS